MPTPTVQKASVVGYVIVPADYLGTLRAQQENTGEARCANDKNTDVKAGAQVVMKDAAGTAVEVLSLTRGYAQWPVGHTDASPANELSCVYAFRSVSVTVPTSVVSFELAGYPAAAVKTDGQSVLRPQIRIGNVRGDWSTYRMTGD